MAGQWGGWNGVHHTLVAEIAGRATAATAVGLVLAVSSAGVIVVPLVFGGFAAGWYTLAAAMAVAILLLAGVRESRREAWR